MPLDREFTREYLPRREGATTSANQEAYMKPEGGMLSVLATALVLMFVSSIMVGQAVNATLLGTVTDSTGAVVAGAKVSITEMKTGLVRASVTNSSGNYDFAAWRRGSGHRSDSPSSYSGDGSRRRKSKA